MTYGEKIATQYTETYFKRGKNVDNFFSESFFFPFVTSQLLVFGVRRLGVPVQSVIIRIKFINRFVLNYFQATIMYLISRLGVSASRPVSQS